MTKNQFYTMLDKKILLCDGAIGTSLQRLNLSEDQFRGERFSDHDIDLTGNYDILNLTNPQSVMSVHSSYLQTGADIITTNSFNATSSMQENFNITNCIPEINKTAAQIARKIAETYSTQTPNHPRYVAGSIGPLNRFSTLKFQNMDNYISQELLKKDYYQQIKALFDGGIDLLLIETITDTSNAIAALQAIEQLIDERNMDPIPVILSITPTSENNPLLSGESLERFINAVMPYQPDAIGFNCCFDFTRIKTKIEQLHNLTDLPLYLAPSAGFPNELNHYPITPSQFTEQVLSITSNTGISLLGGCCGTDTEYISTMRSNLQNFSKRTLHFR